MTEGANERVVIKKPEIGNFSCPAKILIILLATYTNNFCTFICLSNFVHLVFPILFNEFLVSILLVWNLKFCSFPLLNFSTLSVV